MFVNKVKSVTAHPQIWISYPQYRVSSGP